MSPVLENSALGGALSEAHSFDGWKASDSCLTTRTGQEFRHPGRRCRARGTGAGAKQALRARHGAGAAVPLLPLQPSRTTGASQLT